MIESVTSKADDPLHRNPATEISNKYQSLSRQAHEFYAKQKEVMNITQSFIDAGKNRKLKLSESLKCSIMDHVI